VPKPLCFHVTHFQLPCRQTYRASPTLTGCELVFKVVLNGVHIPTTWLWDANDKSAAVEHYWSCRPSSPLGCSQIHPSEC
jgi:hypothetical protein